MRSALSAMFAKLRLAQDPSYPKSMISTVLSVMRISLPQSVLNVPRHVTKSIDSILKIEKSLMIAAYLLCVYSSINSYSGI